MVRCLVEEEEEWCLDVLSLEHFETLFDVPYIHAQQVHTNSAGVGQPNMPALYEVPESFRSELLIVRLLCRDPVVRSDLTGTIYR